MDFENAEEHLLRMYESQPMGVALFKGPDFVYVKINQLMADLNGLPMEAHLGKRLIDVLPDAADNLLPIMRQVLESGEPVTGRRFSMCLPKDPDTPVELIDYLSPITGEGDRPVGVGHLVIDVDARTRAWEDAHRKAREERGE